MTRRPRVDIMKGTGKRTLQKMPNREIKRYSFNWAGGIVTVQAAIDKYPAGNKVTYVLSVRRNKILIERNTYAQSHSDDMMARVAEWRAIPEANYK